MSALPALDGSAAAQTTGQIQALVPRQVLDAEQHQAASLLLALPTLQQGPPAPARRGRIVDVYA